MYLPGPAGGVWSRGGVPAWSGGVSGPGGRCTCLVPGRCLLVLGGVPAWSGGGCTCLVPGGCLVWGVYLPGLAGMYLPGPGGVSGPGGYLPGPGRGGAWSGTPPPVDRMTHACENITLAKTSFRPVITVLNGEFLILLTIS